MSYGQVPPRPIPPEYNSIMTGPKVKPSDNPSEVAPAPKPKLTREQFVKDELGVQNETKDLTDPEKQAKAKFLEAEFAAYDADASGDLDDAELRKMHADRANAKAQPQADLSLADVEEKRRHFEEISNSTKYSDKQKAELIDRELEQMRGTSLYAAVHDRAQQLSDIHWRQAQAHQ